MLRSLYLILFNGIFPSEVLNGYPQSFRVLKGGVTIARYAVT